MTSILTPSHSVSSVSQQAFNYGYLQEQSFTLERSSRSNVHREVQDKFSSSRDHRRRSIGQDLSRLRRLRNIADYDDQCINLSKNTAFALDMAESIISDLKNL